MNAILAANLALRFLLEVAALVAMGAGAWALAEGWLQPVLGIGVPLAAATLWAVFRVSEDGGPPVIETPPPLRLLLELVFFALAVALLFSSGRNEWATVLGAVTLLHYAIGYDRTIRFLTGKGPR
jgi:pimeloyl-ACP methyl ester carboxylesterase